jgi:hypothetical protein
VALLTSSSILRVRIDSIEQSTTRLNSFLMSTVTINPVPIEYRSLIRYDEQWHAIICLKCDGPAAVGRRQLTRHFYSIHGLNAKDYKPLIHALDASGYPMLQTLDEFPCPINDSTPIDGLPILNGLKCNHCGFLSTSAAVMKTHIYNEKQSIRKQDPIAATASIHPGAQPSSLQTWSAHGWKGGYWTVNDPTH